MNETEIKSLVDFFAAQDLPTTPIRLDECTVIESPKDFVTGHLEHIKANMGKENSRPYFDRLLRLKQILESPKRQ